MNGDIAIIGMAVNLPNNILNLDDFWKLILNKETLVKKFPEEREKDLSNYIHYLQDIGIQEPEQKELTFYNGCYFDSIKKFDYNFFNMSPKLASVTDPQQRFLLKTIYMAMEDSGYVGNRISNTNTGVFIGFAANPGGMYSEYIYKVDYTLSQISLTGVIPSMLANRISYLFDLHGPSIVQDCACSSSLVAIHNAKNAIQAGDCDMAIVAGSRLVFSPLISKAGRIGIESSDGYTRTFDMQADGTGYGEGSGAIILKSLNKAEKDYDHIYAVIKGSAVNHDGNKDSITTPNANSQADLLHRAWSNAGIDPASICYIEAHGTATHIGDPIEIDGIRKAYHEHVINDKFPIGTVKANIGHLYEGSGIFGFIKAALVLKNKIIPAQANFNVPNPVLNIDESPIFVPTETSLLKPRNSDHCYCGVSAFGLGGTNCHIVLEDYNEFRSVCTSQKESNDLYIFTISAKDEESLNALVLEYIHYLNSHDNSLLDICYSTNVTRSQYNVKLGICFSKKEEILEILNNISNYKTIKTVHVVQSNSNKINKLIVKTDSNNIIRDWISRDYLDVKKLYTAQNVKVISLPVYSFNEHNCWIDFPNDYKINCLKSVVTLKNSLTYCVKFLPVSYSKIVNSSLKTLVITDGEEALPFDIYTEKYSIFVYQLKQKNEYLFCMEEQKRSVIIGDLINYIVANNISNIIYTICTEKTIAKDYEDFTSRVHKNLYSLFLIIQAFIINGLELKFSIVTNNSLKVEDDENPLVPENSTLAGFSKVVQREYPNLRMKLIDISTDYNKDNLLSELLSDNMGVFAIRNYTLFKECFDELSLELPSDEMNNYIHSGGTYLITGGAGSLGMEVCKLFVRKQPDINLILLNRTEIPPESEWDSIIQQSENEKECTKLNNFKYLISQGAKLSFYQCDVSEKQNMDSIMKRIREKFGKINGVVHAAGVPGKSIIQLRSLEDFDFVIRPKVFGTYLLESLTAIDKPDFYLYFSSVATVFPSVGQADYAAGNYYLDTISQVANKNISRHITCDWVAWKEVGMAVDYHTNQDTTFKAISTEDAINIIDKSLQLNQPRVFGGQINYDSDLIRILPSFDIILSDIIKNKIELSLRSSEEKIKNNYLILKEKIDKIDVNLKNIDNCENKDLTLLIAKCWSHSLGFTEFDINDDFLDCGGDSIAALSVVNDISIYIGKELSLSSFMSNSTIASLAIYVEKNLINSDNTKEEPNQ
jgi:phthiocerol/phenolphthiocerol synthesis type-I polyketide synthase B